jgi:alkanesulfonate monooxygenase SsuD/methylene tetrahydromethanopterin reductase-like flavin-dependent oxidoreductase (luciferase family)
MRVGLILPVFERSPDPALMVARLAEAEGIDGVFSYDHMFPINRPDRPALASTAMLAAAAVATDRIRLGPLVSRVTLLPPTVLVSALSTLNEVSGGRVIAGIGTGDSLTAAENEAYGFDFPPVAERLAVLADTARALRRHGVTTWIGGRSRAVKELAAAEADGWNAWDGSLEEIAAFARLARAEVTWAGPPPADGDFATHLQRVARAGPTWTIYGPPPTIDWPRFVSQLAEAAESVR